MCPHTEYDADVGYICSIMEKPCPYVKPHYTEECVEMVRNLEIEKAKNINSEVQKIWRKE